ncbi:MAG: histidine kinase dimerization/phospho-acceptor domain-containing protein [Asticcacaulis sp.]
MSLVEPKADAPSSETASWSLDPHGADKDSKRTFLRMVSHELRTPLNSIIGFSDILHQELYGPLGSPHYVEYAGIIKESGTKLPAPVQQFPRDRAAGIGRRARLRRRTGAADVRGGRGPGAQCDAGARGAPRYPPA